MVEMKSLFLFPVFLMISLLSGVSQAATFEVFVAQSSYQAVKNQSITLEWTFTTRTQGSYRDLFVICELRTPEKTRRLYVYRDGDEVPETQDEQFSGRVQIDKVVLREGRIRLHVSRLRTNDSGLYQCEVKTEDGFGSAGCRLNVSDQTKVVGHEPIRAKVGDDVILPCHLEPPYDVSKLTIEWRVKGLDSNGSNVRIIHLHRSRAKDDESPDSEFKGRTFMFHDEFEKGNISLKLTNLTKEDEGNYTCFVPKLESQVRNGNVALKVDENGPKGKLTDPEGGNGENNKGRDIGLGVGIPVGIIIIIIIIAGLCYWRSEQNRRRNGNQEDVNAGIPLRDNQTNMNESTPLS